MIERLIDLKDKEYKEVKRILTLCFDKEVWAFGSRVKWTTGRYADLDLVIFEASSTQIEQLQEAFDESNLTFIVQILQWENIPQNFKDTIQEKYIILQKKKEKIKIFFETNFKKTEIGKIPKDWEIKKIKEIGEVKSGDNLPKNQKTFWNGNKNGLSKRFTRQ